MGEAAPLEEYISVRACIFLIVHQCRSQRLSATWQRLRLSQQLPKVPDTILRVASKLAAAFCVLRHI